MAVTAAVDNTSETSGDLNKEAWDKYNLLRAALLVYHDTDGSHLSTGDVVLKALFDANTILAANADDTPAALTVAASRIIGRASTGNIAALTAAQVNTILSTATKALDNLTAVAINTSLISDTDNTDDLGSAAKEWKDLYIDGTANIDSLVADTADINGGTIDGITALTAGGNLDIGAHGFRANTLTADGLTAGRVVFTGTAGLLSESAELAWSSPSFTISTADTDDPAFILKTTNATISAHEVKTILDESAAHDHIDVTGETASVDFYYHLKAKDGQTMQFRLYSGAAYSTITHGSADHLSIVNSVGDANLILGIKDDVTAKTITWNAADDRLEHSAGTFNFHDDNLTTTGTLTATTIGAFQATGAIDFNSQAMTSVDINSGVIGGVTLDGAIAGGDQAFTGVGDMTFTNGSILKSGASASDTLLLAANDTTCITLTTGATDKVEFASVNALVAINDIDIGAHDFRAATVTPDGLTATRVVFAGTAGVLSDDSDLTFVTDTLTATKVVAPTSLTTPSIISTSNADITIQPNGTGDTVIYGRSDVVTAKTTTATLTIAEAGTITVSAASAYTITLPTASGHTGLTYHFIKTDANYNLITLDGNSTETFNYAVDGGAATQTYVRLNTYCAEVTIVSDGTNWQCINERIGQRPYCLFYLTNEQSDIADNTWVHVLLDATSFDIGSNANTGTSLYVIPIAGKYFVEGSQNWINVVADGKFNPAVYLNDAAEFGAAWHSSSTASMSPFFMSIRTYAASDELKFYTKQVTGAATADIQGGVGNTWMLIRLEEKL